jgi:Clp amino terminal domain, pathogenicity island component
MFERFTSDARATVVGAQEHARRLGHSFIGCEHLLLAVCGTAEPAGAALRAHGVTPARVESEIVRLVGPGRTSDLLCGLDREALAWIGIDLDTVRARIEERFGPAALSRPVAARRRRLRPVAARRRPLRPVRLFARRERECRDRQPSSTPGQVPRGHLPFTPRAKKSLERTLREAQAMRSGHLGTEHLALALVGMDDGAVPAILAALGAAPAALRAAILDRYRQAS